MRARIVYWIATVAAAAFMLMTAIPDVLRIPQAIAVIMHLGYPPYLLLFLGIAKTFGVIVILTPGLLRLKEWAFAGLAFDVIGALYSHLSVGDPPSAWMPAVIALVLLTGAYLSFRRSLPEARLERFTHADAARA